MRVLAIIIAAQKRANTTTPITRATSTLIREHLVISEHNSRVYEREKVFKVCYRDVVRKLEFLLILAWCALSLVPLNKFYGVPLGILQTLKTDSPWTHPLSSFKPTYFFFYNLPSIAFLSSLFSMNCVPVWKHT